MKDPKVYTDSIILIGPPGSRKKELANVLRERTGLPIVELDELERLAKERGDDKLFNSASEFYYTLITSAYDNLQVPTIFNLTGAHSAWWDDKLTNQIRNLSEKFQKVYLILPTENKIEALKIIEKNKTHLENGLGIWEFLNSQVITDLENRTIYTHLHDLNEIADIILKKD